ncbi:MAG: hypothetical protein EAZ57_07575 [Cytophagales bacterium]|nr:MAG: hypothetical protein EAZ67_08660 [Cytophagales bacterium]TAF60397.1 MAG: hypothetical protein EAZ57_07575 [Cytophagales bacterium]
MRWIDIFAAWAYYAKAISFTTKHRLWGSFVVPVLLNLLLFVSLLAFVGFAAYKWSPIFGDYIAQRLDISVFWIRLVSALAGMVIMLMLYKNIMLIMLAPTFGTLAEKVLKARQPEYFEAEFSIRTTWHNLKRGFSMTLRYTPLELLLSFLLFMIGLFWPFISPITTLMVLLVQSYFLGLGFFDYTLEVKGVSGVAVRQWAWQQKYAQLGIGSGFILLCLLPFIGFILAPCLAVVASSLALEEYGKGLEMKANRT